MENLLIDIVPIALLIITIIGMRPVKPFSSFNDDYLSLSTGKYYRGVFAIVIVLHHIMQNTSTGYIMPQFLGAGVFTIYYVHKGKKPSFSWYKCIFGRKQTG